MFSLQRMVQVSLLLLAGSSAQQAYSITINWEEAAGGGGFNANEQGVINAAIDWWEMLIVNQGPNGPAAFNVSITQAPDANIGTTFNLSENANNIPTDADITIDDGTNFNFFVDTTPHESSEFVRGNNPYHGLPKAGGGTGGNATGRVDMLEVVKHELGHALGFSRGFTLFAAAEGPPLTLTYAPGMTATLVASPTHLDPTVHPDDLMADEPLADITGGQRWTQSPLDLNILAGIYGYAVDHSRLEIIGIPEPCTLSLFTLGLLALTKRRRRS